MRHMAFQTLAVTAALSAGHTLQPACAQTLAAAGSTSAGTSSSTYVAPQVGSQSSSTNSSATSTNISTLSNPANSLPGIPRIEPPPPANSGLLGSYGKSISDMGIDIHGSFIDLFSNNPNTGIVTGRMYNLGVLTPSFDFNLQKLLGIPGATVHIDESFFILRHNSTYILDVPGLYQGLPAIPNLTTTYLTLFTYEQKLFHDKLDIEVGRTNSNRFFGVSNCFSPITCQEPVLVIDADRPPPFYSVWGGRVAYHLSPAWYVQAGAYEDDFRLIYGNGWTLSTKQATGALLLAEIGNKTDFPRSDKPGSYEVGGYYNTSGPYTTKGIPFLDPLHHPYRGGGGLFFHGTQVIWHKPGPPGPETGRIDLFAGAAAGLDADQPVHADLYAGIGFIGLIPTRKDDVINLKVRYARLNQLQATMEQETRVALGGPNVRQSPNISAFELNAHIQISPAIAFEPIADYFVNPDTTLYGGSPRPQHDGWILSGAFIVSIGRLLGTSHLPY